MVARTPITETSEILMLPMTNYNRIGEKAGWAVGVFVAASLLGKRRLRET